jgi:hypothetical protein
LIYEPLDRMMNGGLITAHDLRKLSLRFVTTGHKGADNAPV